MGWSLLEIIDDPLEGELLVAGGGMRKGGAYIAKIVGTDPKYKYARQFLGKKDYRFPGTPKDCVVVKVPLTDLQKGDLLEIRCGGSWKNDYRQFYLFLGWDVAPITQEELRRRLAEKLAAKKAEAEVQG